MAIERHLGLPYLSWVRTVDLHPGGLIHFAARLPHAVEAVEPSRLQLTLLDPRVKA